MLCYFIFYIEVIKKSNTYILYLSMPKKHYSYKTVLANNTLYIFNACPNTCPHHSRLIRNLITDLAVSQLRTSEKLTHITKRTTREKLLSYLSTEAKKQVKTEFNISFNRQQLADYLSVERSAMSAELSKMQREGLLSYHKNHFKLNIN